MKTRLVLPVAALALVAFTALAAACGGSSSGSPAGPTEPELTALDQGEGDRDFINSFAESDADAVSFAREVFTGCPPYCGAQIDSVQYVETTAAQAETIFPALKSWGAPGDLTVWVVVAQGHFPIFAIGDPTHRGPGASSLWVIFPKGRDGSFFFDSNAQYHLSQLGTVHNVPLPLPPFPTPVALADE